jgi:hypothetical protein
MTETMERVKLIDLEQYSDDGRLTDSSDGSIFDYRRMYEIVELLGRPLSVQEAQEYRIK